ncbi:cuticle protein 7-like [Onthophagus taurus]|uniref:cuticle protein 7-like n=1 Tax=Onthophagus taurus TaxID=166361 RepID=UPI000C201439|nr:cuticle protein 7-like [Onthophagus taurus]
MFLKTFNKLGLIVLAIIIFCVKRNFCENPNDVVYSFKYAIDQGNIGLRTHHFEERNGDLVRGSYSLLEHDGRIRIVEYEVAGPKGFRAVINYRRPPGPPIMGHLKFPQYLKNPIILAKPVGYITKDLFLPYNAYHNMI